MSPCISSALARIATGWRVGITPRGGYQVYRQGAPGLHIYLALNARDALRKYKERVHATLVYQALLSDPGERGAVFQSGLPTRAAAASQR